MNQAKRDIHLRHIEQILKSYQPPAPLHLFVNAYFKKQPQAGSRDRRIVRAFCFSYFRCLGAFDNSFDFHKKLFISAFICENKSNMLFNKMLTEITGLSVEQLDKPIEEKIESVQKLYKAFNIDMLFPTGEELSTGVTHQELCKSMLVQPALFVRIRKPSYKKSVMDEFDKKHPAYECVDGMDNMIRLPNNSKIDDSYSYKNGMIEIQDISSAMSTGFMEAANADGHWWDLCAGAGGKSILLYDLFPEVKLFLTDNRENILHNLKKRFNRNKISTYRAELADVSHSAKLVDFPDFDGIIADVPCSGSGTWRRNPEQVQAFKAEKLNHWVELQRSILKNAVSKLKVGKPLLYFTCSVFRKENEENVEWLEKVAEVKCEKQHLLNGLDAQGDMLFAALFRKTE